MKNKFCISQKVKLKTTTLFFNVWYDRHQNMNAIVLSVDNNQNFPYTILFDDGEIQMMYDDQLESNL